MICCLKSINNSYWCSWASTGVAEYVAASQRNWIKHCILSWKNHMKIIKWRKNIQLMSCITKKKCFHVEKVYWFKETKVILSMRSKTKVKCFRQLARNMLDNMWKSGFWKLLEHLTYWNHIKIRQFGSK